MSPKDARPGRARKASEETPALDYRDPAADPPSAMRKFLEPSENVKAIKKMVFEFVVGGLGYIISMGIAMVLGFAIAWWSVKGCK